MASFAVAGRDRGFKRETARGVDEPGGWTLVPRGDDGDSLSCEPSSFRYIAINRDLKEIVKEWAWRVGRSQVKHFERTLAKARAKDSLRAFAKLTHLVEGQPRIIHDPPLIVPIEELAGEHTPARVRPERTPPSTRCRVTTGGILPRDRRRLLERYRYVHAARKVVGVGSVGTRAWIMLMLGRDDRDPLFLQMKEAEASVLERYLGGSEFGNHGQRVVEGQRLMQAASDIVLGWIRTPEWIDGVGRDFYIRQLWDGKARRPST